MKIPDELLDRIEQLAKDLKPYSEILTIYAENGSVMIHYGENFADTFPNINLKFDEMERAFPEAHRNGIEYDCCVYKSELEDGHEAD